MMPKGDTIAEIMRINRSARAEFLSEFSSEDLAQYLDRLNIRRAVACDRMKPRPHSPGETAVQTAARQIRKDAPFRFTPDTTSV